MEQFDKIIKLKKLKAIHINNSKTPFNSHKDRHECLSEGTIPVIAFKKIMQDSRFSSIPKILETPNPEKYMEEINLLKSFS